MTFIELRFDLPDRLARDAEAAGLLNKRAIARLLKDGLARQAAQELAKGASLAVARGSRPMSMHDIQAEVRAVRKAA